MQRQLSFILRGIDANVSMQFGYEGRPEKFSTVTWYSVQRDDLQFSMHISVYRDGQWIDEFHLRELEVSRIGSVDYALELDEQVQNVVWQYTYPEGNRYSVGR